jgi:hypothetical protein
MAAMRIMTANTRWSIGAEIFFSASVAPPSPPMSAAAANGKTTRSSIPPLIPCAANAMPDNTSIRTEFIAAICLGPANPRNRMSGPRNTPPPIPRKPERNPITSPAGIPIKNKRRRPGYFSCSCAFGAFRNIAMAAIARVAANITKNIFRSAVINPPRNAAGMAGNKNGSKSLQFKRPAKPKRSNAAPVTTMFNNRTVDGIVAADIPKRDMMARYPVPPPRPTEAYTPATTMTRGTRNRKVPSVNVSDISCHYSYNVLLFSPEGPQTSSFSPFSFQKTRTLNLFSFTSLPKSCR